MPEPPPEDWVPPLICDECNHTRSKPTDPYCETCRAPLYCNVCAGRIAEEPPPEEPPA